MRLFIDTDTTGLSPSWEGFEYIINRSSPENNKALLEKSEGGTDFSAITEVPYTVKGNILQIAVPREALGLTDNDVKFNFKWSDNIPLNDAMSFYESGDCAPGGRFTFVFDSAATEKADEEINSCGFLEFFAKIRSFFADIRIFIIKLFRNITD